MNTERAKNLTIIFLLALNLMLLSLVYINSTKYNITKKQETAILRLLEQKNIKLGSKLIKSYKPMKLINVLPFEYDKSTIAAAFLENLDDVYTIEEFDRTVYTRDDEYLEIQGGYIVYENNSTSSEASIENEEIATSVSEEYLKKLSFLFPGLKLDNLVYNEHLGYIIEYRSYFKGSTVFSNFIKFYIDEFGIYGIECHYSKIDGFETSPKEIRPVDEALYALTLELESIGAYAPGKITITKMDIVYYQNESSSTENTATKATPCYRFYTDLYDDPVIIDAATCTVKSQI